MVDFRFIVKRTRLELCQPSRQSQRCSSLILLILLIPIHRRCHITHSCRWDPGTARVNRSAPSHTSGLWPVALESTCNHCVFMPPRYILSQKLFSILLIEVSAKIPQHSLSMRLVLASQQAAPPRAQVFTPGKSAWSPSPNPSPVCILSSLVAQGKLLPLGRPPPGPTCTLGHLMHCTCPIGLVLVDAW